MRVLPVYERNTALNKYCKSIAMQVSVVVETLLDSIEHSQEYVRLHYQ